MDKIKKLLIVLLIIILHTTYSLAENKNIIAGETRLETAIEISKKFNKSEKVILVNSTSSSDILCSTSLASQKNCPILLIEENKIQTSVINEIKRLKVKSAYLIGGEKVISKYIEKELNSINVNPIRISGKDRYETSIKIADIMDNTNKVNEIVLSSGNEVADVVTIAPIAGSRNMPIILTKKDSLGEYKNWLDKMDIKNTYIISKEEISDKILKYLKNPIKIIGKDIYEINSNIIDKFYQGKTLDKIYLCKGKIGKNDELIDAMLISPLAANENVPIVIVDNKVSSYQEEVLKSKKIKSIVQVGYGISEESVKDIYKIKDSFKEPVIPDTPKPPSKPENADIPDVDEEATEPEKPNIPDIENPDIGDGGSTDTEETINPENPNEPEEDKNIINVKNEEELRNAISDHNVETIKLISNIQTKSDPIIIRRKITIDGSNSNGNYSISSLKHKQSTFIIDSKNVLLKNIDINSDQKAIVTMRYSGIELENINVSSKASTVAPIDIMTSTLIAKNVNIYSNYAGIIIREYINLSSKEDRSNLVLKGEVYNLNKDKNNDYYPSIIVENKINDEYLNKIIIDESLSEDYLDKNYSYKLEQDKKQYEKYYKKF